MNDLSLLAHGDTFTELFCLVDSGKQPVHKQQVHVERKATSEQVPVFHNFPQLRPGPKPYHEQFPELVTTVTEFVKMHDFSGESRR